MGAFGSDDSENTLLRDTEKETDQCSINDLIALRIETGEWLRRWMEEVIIIFYFFRPLLNNQHTFAISCFGKVRSR